MGLKDRLGKYRRKSGARISVLLILILVVIGLIIFVERLRVFLIAILILLLTAFGLELSGTDFDLGKLLETRSLGESRVEKTEGGTWLIGEECQKEKLNCDNFEFQQDAQDLFEKCGGLENDIHRLDGDNDGIVCEALPSR